MALTDAERLQMVMMALMKYSVHYKEATGVGGIFLGKAEYGAIYVRDADVVKGVVVEL